MDEQTAQLALQFLNRVQLTGSEVGAFVRVSQALQLLAQLHPRSTPEPEPGPEPAE